MTTEKTTPPAPWNDRRERHLPGKNPSPVKVDPKSLGKLLLRRVAPATEKKFNVIHLTTWFEVRLVSAHGAPISGETCQLLEPAGRLVEKKTDQDGLVRFEGLPIVPTLEGDAQDCIHPAVVFPDILEEWASPPPGTFGKNHGERNDHRKYDGMVHFIPELEMRTEVKLDRLTEEQKLQHFIHAHTDNGAHYAQSNPRVYSEKDQRWNWGVGSVCNQHVNFFLGYWYNYGKDFTTAASATVMSYLPLFSSAMHNLDGHKHRGYLEFVRPVTGFGASQRKTFNPDEESTWLADEDCKRASKCIEYIRIARYFDYDSGEPTDEGGNLLDALAPINVYSLSDITHDSVDGAEHEIRSWLKAHKATKATGKTDKDIEKMKSSDLWRIAFDLDDDDPVEHRLSRVLYGKVNWDHHAGVLLVRSRGGGELIPSTPKKDRELWTFSADGGDLKHFHPIEFKPFASADLHRRFVHMGIFRCKPLTVGGFAPPETSGNKGHISCDNPPRFIHWG